jgi:hypothetical protein
MQSFTNKKETAMSDIHKFLWQDMEITIEYAGNYSDAYRETYGVSLIHLEINCAFPLPITETGYRSCFIRADQMAEWESPVEFIKSWLDKEMNSPKWIELEAQTRQFNLF